MLSVLSFLFACQTMDNPGAMFEQVKVAETTTVTSNKNKNENTTKEPEENEENIDPMFQSREEVIIVGGSEVTEEVKKDAHSEIPVSEEHSSKEPKESKESKEPKEPKETKEVFVEPKDVAIPAAQVIPAQPMRVSRVKDGWRPTLIASVMEGPTPRAILAMPSGEEKIVKAGDLLSEEGVVVMTIGSSFVELAVINSSEGRAKIENLTLTEQF